MDEKLNTVRLQRQLLCCHIIVVFLNQRSMFIFLELIVAPLVNRFALQCRDFVFAPWPMSSSSVATKKPWAESSVRKEGKGGSTSSSCNPCNVLGCAYRCDSQFQSSQEDTDTCSSACRCLRERRVGSTLLRCTTFVTSQFLHRHPQHNLSSKQAE